MNLLVEKAMFTVSKDDNPGLTVNIRFTSPAFDGHITEDERRAELVAKVIQWMQDGILPKSDS